MGYKTQEELGMFPTEKALQGVIPIGDRMKGLGVVEIQLDNNPNDPNRIAERQKLQNLLLKEESQTRNKGKKEDAILGSMAYTSDNKKTRQERSEPKKSASTDRQNPANPGRAAVKEDYRTTPSQRISPKSSTTSSSTSAKAKTKSSTAPAPETNDLSRELAVQQRITNDLKLKQYMDLRAEHDGFSKGIGEIGISQKGKYIAEYDKLTELKIDPKKYEDAANKFVHEVQASQGRSSGIESGGIDSPDKIRSDFMKIAQKSGKTDVEEIAKLGKDYNNARQKFVEEVGGQFEEKTGMPLNPNLKKAARKEFDSAVLDKMGEGKGGSDMLGLGTAINKDKTVTKLEARAGMVTGMNISDENGPVTPGYARSRGMDNNISR